MSARLHPVLAALAMSFIVGTAHAADTPSAVQRYVLSIGANDGGADRVRLRYATSDAEGFAEVMGTYGGVQPPQMLLVLEPDRAGVDAAFAELHARVGDAPGRTEVLVFYSGHADEKGLLLGGQRLPYAELRAHLQAVPADVRIAIVDACASGALTRAKGGTRQPPFLIDQASKVTGHAYLASASADEAAQESDRLEASFFSHALLTGLRGAADVSADGVVTLGEAYQFAFRETLARTEGTRLGAQHPSYDMQLVGSGDVVLTDLRQTSASLLLDDTVAGRIFVRDADGRLIAELDKAGGQPIRLGLAPGSYRMRLDTRDGQQLTGAVALMEGRTTRVDTGSLALARLEDGVARGGGVRSEARASAVGVSILPGLSTDGGDAHRDISINILAGRSRSVSALEMGALVNTVAEDVDGVQLAGVLNVVGGRVSGVQLAGVGSIASGDTDDEEATAGAAVDGVQAGGVAAVADGVEGVQLGGVTSIADDVGGVQAAGVIAVADDVDGVQTAGVIAIADDVDGVQAGLISIAEDVNGLQVGLVTVAENVDGLAIALIPWIANGRHHVEVFSTELAWFNIGGRLGGGGFHTLISGGYQPLDRRINATVGFGGEIVGETFELDLDLLTTTVIDEEDWRRKPDFIASARILVGLRFADHFRIFAGGSWNVAINPVAFDPGFEPVIQLAPDPSIFIDQWPGAIAGVRF